MHTPNEYDLAGFCVGIVEKSEIIDGRSIVAGDVVIGIASSGLHSNGFSLIRRILAEFPDAPRKLFEGRPLIEQLLAPTRIYVRSVLSLIKKTTIKGIAHITGGGLTENIPRVLPRGLGVTLKESAWSAPNVYQWLADVGVARAEMHRTFNCGVGMVLVVAPDNVGAALEHLAASGEQAWVIGEVVPDAEQMVTIV
jgi:phosphoribosylformylglycinamidine cyclo-ligase